MARWLLAHAANERVAGRIENSLDALQRSYQRDPDIVLDVEYWNTRFQIAFDRAEVQYEELEVIVRHAISSMKKSKNQSRSSRLAMYFSTTLMDQKYWSLAIELMENVFAAPTKRTAEQNNHLAYCRSLSKSGLPLALMEVDLALKSAKEPAFLDTKAWVLYHSDDYENAIELANQAVAGYEKEIKTYAPTLFELLSKSVEAIAIDSKEPHPHVDGEEGEIESHAPDKSQAPDKESSSAIPNLWKRLASNLAVVRYHRARILERLGRQEEANSDLNWIRSIGFADPSVLESK